MNIEVNWWQVDDTLTPILQFRVFLGDKSPPESWVITLNLLGVRWALTITSLGKLIWRYHPRKGLGIFKMLLRCSLGFLVIWQAHRLSHVISTSEASSLLFPSNNSWASTRMQHAIGSYWLQPTSFFRHNSFQQPAWQSLFHWAPALQGCNVGRQSRLHSVGLHGVCARGFQVSPISSVSEVAFLQKSAWNMLNHVETSNNFEPFAFFSGSTLLPGIHQKWSSLV